MAAAARRSKLNLGICQCRCLCLANLTTTEIHFCVSSCELRVASPAHARAFVSARASQVFTCICPLRTVVSSLLLACLLARLLAYFFVYLVDNCLRSFSDVLTIRLLALWVRARLFYIRNLCLPLPGSASRARHTQ